MVILSNGNCLGGGEQGGPPSLSQPYSETYKNHSVPIVRTGKKDLEWLKRRFDASLMLDGSLNFEHFPFMGASMMKHILKVPVPALKKDLGYPG